MDKLQEYQLEFTGDRYVGFNIRTGSVILGDVKKTALYKFIFSQEDGYYRKEWKRECPVISNKHWIANHVVDICQSWTM